MVALIRPTDWNWILLFHLLSAFALVGGVLLVSLTSLAAARSGRPEQVPLLRTVAFRTNLLLVVPAFVLVQVFGTMLADREFPGDDPGWLGVSFAVTTIATLVALALAAVQLWVLRRQRAGRPAGRPAQVATWVPPLVLAALVAVVVLMAGKPT